MGKRILHIIDSLVRGGAELILVKSIASLPGEYDNYVVVLRQEDELLAESTNITKIYKLGWRGKYDTLFCAFKLRAIIQEERINLVHAHLYWSTVVARLAVPANVPLVFTVHSELSQEVFNGSAAGKWLERLTYSPKQQAVFVSEAAKADYARYVAISNKGHVIFNFVDDVYFREDNRKECFSSKRLKLVTVANLKRLKNHQLLLQAMTQLSLPEVSLDIIGEGPERANLQKQINALGLQNVSLKGAQANVAACLKHYDVFVLASASEGFCVAMAEAMAVGLPCLVSDLPVLREVSGENQLYFASGSADDLAKKIRLLTNSRDKLEQLKQAGAATAQKYRIANYTVAMVSLYEKAFEQQQHEV